WKTKIYFDYGYIKRTEGADGDHLDVFIGNDKKSEIIFIVNQVDPKTQKFDEHKIMFCFPDSESAKKGYLKNYERGWKGLGSVIPLTLDQFREWIEKGSQKHELKNVKISFMKSDLAKVKNEMNESMEITKAFIESGKKDIKDIVKSTLIEIQKGGKRRQDGETWTQPSGRRVKKTGGKIIPVSEGRKKAGSSEGKPEKKAEKPESSDKKSIYDTVLSLFKKGEIKGDTKKPEKAEKQPTEAQEKPSKQTEGNGKDTAEKSPEQDSKGVPEAKGKGISVPADIPFKEIKIQEQYTDKKDFDKQQIETLKNRILENGYDPAFPIMVDQQKGAWTVVAGHHRYIAVAQLITEGKLPGDFKIPVVTKEFATDNDRIAAQVAENQRRNVLPTDESKAYGKMLKNGWDAKRISKELGKTTGEVNRRLALNNLEKDLFQLVSRKDKSLPLGVAEAIGTAGKDANGNPDHSLQLKAFKWYAENRSKYPGRGPSAVQSYMKDVQSDGFANMDFDSVATDIQKEAMRTIGSTDRAIANKKMIDGMIDNLMKSYQRILGENINSINPETIKELAASLAVSGGKAGASPVMSKLDAVIYDLSKIKESISQKMAEIESDSQTPMMFGLAKSTLYQTIGLIDKFTEFKNEIGVTK
ncbi:MAG: ParB N-terminal domain-containing protein, partial [Cyclobacteriaceae bacterium]|nr:ParB N-terminal domain-containing protein [Cyclobacteriaceae bacterium]